MVSQLDSHDIGVATASLGMHPRHTLEDKFSALQKAGFRFVELGFADYVAWIRQHNPGLPPTTCPPEWCEGDEPDPSDDELWAALYDSAAAIKALAASHGLTISMLQPLNQFDGWRTGTRRAEWVRRKAEKWLPLCARLGVEALQVGSNDKADADAGDGSTAAELRWLAELGARQDPPVKIAYETWCFSHRVTDWEHTLRLVEMGDHPNLGLCLDVAHWPLAREYGWDVCHGGGWERDAYDAMLDRVRSIPPNKIFYVEISDVVRPDPPLGQGSAFDEWSATNAPARGDVFSWIICGRPLPLIGRHAGTIGPKGDCGGRVVESLRAILETGYKGPIVFEFFEALRMEQDDPAVPTDYAQACALSLKLLKEEL